MLGARFTRYVFTVAVRRGGRNPPVQELYERLVEAERQRAEAEKARGDDLREIALRLASGKKGERVAVSALSSMLSSNV